ncbi:MAG: restriction endonuclease subunit S [bacterium]|nr:restriction endonuclease subunit S [bacterium]
MKSYEKYKNSGIEWLGEIPEHWDVKKLKHVARINPTKDSTIDKESLALVVFLPMEKVKENGDISCKLMKPISDLWNGFTFFKRNDVIIAKITPCFENGKGAILNKLETEIGFGSTEFHVLRTRKSILPEFLYFITKSELFMKIGEAFMTGAAGQKRVPTDFISESRFAFPSIPEQTTIADFLDRKTAELDSLIEKKAGLIHLYEEEKAALINQAVTKGLDPQAGMKPSGIEWLGDIPAHWEVKPLTTYLDSIVDYRGRTPKKQDEGMFLVTARNIKNGAINYNLSQEFVDYDDAKTLLDRGKPMIGDVLFTTEAPLGEVANVDREDIALAQRIIKFRGKTDILTNIFLKYWLMSNSFQDHLKTFATGSTAIGIKASKLNNLKLLLPSISEQTAIVTHIETECARLGAIIAKFRKQIELFKEYRTTLISEAVTGKIDVREA